MALSIIKATGSLLTEQKVREIVREEIAAHRKKLLARQAYEAEKWAKHEAAISAEIDDDYGDKQP